MKVQASYSFKKFVITVTIPIVVFWTILFFLGYPLPSKDDIFFTGAAINLAKGGEFTNPYIESWNNVLSSGKFYFQPPFHSYTLAGWLKIAGISTNSLLFFQYLCYILFSLASALIFRAYNFPRVTAFGITILFAIWHCNPNPYHSTGFRQDALGMAFLALGLLLMTKDIWWTYFLSFCLLESAVLTAPINIAYGFSFGLAILAINFIDRRKFKINYLHYFLKIGITFISATALIFVIFLLCINFELNTFISDFLLHASWRRTSTMQAIPVFVNLISNYYGIILYVPSYILFFLMCILVFHKRLFIAINLKILFIGLTLGMLLNIFLYTSAIGFNFFFCWVGIIAIVFMINWPSKIKIAVYLVIITLFLSSQIINTLSLIGREYVSESQYQEIREYVLANPNRKYAIDEVAARFVFDYKLPKNSTSWTFMQAPGSPLMTAKDKQKNVTWIVAKSWLGQSFPELLTTDYPKVEFMGRKFNSLPKKPFEIIVIP